MLSVRMCAVERAYARGHVCVNAIFILQFVFGALKTAAQIHEPNACMSVHLQYLHLVETSAGK